VQHLDLEKSVSKYYDGNTKRFMKFGQGGETGSIHRAVFSEKNVSRVDAFRYHENNILNIIEKENPSLVVDLGCGAGGSISYLSSKYNTRYHGITISPIQAEMANYLIADQNISISLGSYLDINSYKDIKGIKGHKLFFAVESYLHCPDREKFFDIIRMQTNPGDFLVLFDDFRTNEEVVSNSDLRDIRDFTSGWHAADLQSLEDVQSLAKSKGFTLKSNIDLTKWLEIDRQRDYLIAFLVPILRVFKMKNSWWQNLLGGNALRKGLKKGWLSYRFFVWERSFK